MVATQETTGPSPRRGWAGARAIAQAITPGYVSLLQSGELSERVRSAWTHLSDCALCPHRCHVDRRRTTAGAVCRTGERAVVASVHPHFGEEAPLVGRHGSGTIFFTFCNLRCQFCQNHEISQEGEGHEVTPRQLAAMMLHLQELGCHNVNLVTPSHVVPQILAALLLGAEQGLCIPLVYNTGGYDGLESLRLLDGVVDIYMPDMKYAYDAQARTHSKIRGYCAANRAAVKEMHRQVGDLVVDEAGVAQRGLLVRHLVMPNDVAGTLAVMRFLASEISPRTYVNIMGQYRPAYRAHATGGIDRVIRAAEYERALRAAKDAGLSRLDRG